jgi:hypothetical protein
MSCDTCSSSDSLADGFKGAMQGLSGLIGLSSFWNPLNDSELNDSISRLKDTKEKWDQKIQTDEGQLTESQVKLANLQTKMMQTTIDLHDETLAEDISKNSLEISIIFIIMIIILGYLLVS